jgi:hypothetical protein
MAKKTIRAKATAKDPKGNGKSRSHIAEDSSAVHSASKSPIDDNSRVDVRPSGGVPSPDEETLSDAAPFNKTYGVKHERQ